MEKVNGKSEFMGYLNPGIGRKEWKINSGYHQRSLNETVMFRYKTSFGGEMTTTKFEHRSGEPSKNRSEYKMSYLKYLSKAKKTRCLQSSVKKPRK